MHRVLAALALLFSLALSAQSFDSAALDAAVASEMKAADIPGAALVVVRDGKIAYRKGYGVTSVEDGIPVTPATLFRLGSTTKSFVALSVLRLAAQGKVDLRAPISTYAPDLDSHLGTLTLEQLLTHSAGLADDTAMQGPLDESALAQRVRSMNEKSFFTQPGDVMSYANPGYAVISYVVEKVTGKPFADAMRDLLFLPLGMKRSTFRFHEAATYPLAQAHDRNPEGAYVLRPAPDNAANYAPGSLFTSAEEAGHLLLALLGDSASPPDWQSLAAGAVDVPASKARYAHGIFVADAAGSPLLYNAGARLGYGSFFAILPRQRAAVFIMANRSGAMMTGAARQALGSLLPADLLATPPSSPVPISAAEAQNAAGAYANGTELRVELLVQDGKLMLKWNGRTMPVAKDASGHFHAAGPLQDFVLLSGAGGAIRYLGAQARALRKLN